MNRTYDEEIAGGIMRFGIKIFLILILAFALTSFLGCATFQQSVKDHNKKEIFSNYLTTFYEENNKERPDFQRIFNFYTPSSVERNGGLKGLIEKSKAIHFLRDHSRIVFYEKSLKLDGNEFEYNVSSELKSKPGNKSYYKLSGYIVIMDGKIDFMKFKEPEEILREDTVTIEVPL